MNLSFLYLHIIFACVWIGGMITLVGFIIYTKGAKDKFFYKFTTYYGWLNVAVLVLLTLSGAWLMAINGLHHILFQRNVISDILWVKMVLVFFMYIATIYHSLVVLKVKNRTNLQNILSKISSFYLLFSSLVVLYFAISLRDLL